MSLYTGKRLHLYDWVEAPIDEDVIARVESMAKEEGQPTITDNMPLFEWGKDEVIEDDPEYSEILSGDDIEQLSPIISQITEEDGHGW